MSHTQVVNGRKSSFRSENGCTCNIAPPSSDPTSATYDPLYAGITLFQARNNTTPAVFAGNGSGSIVSGTLYVPDGPTPNSRERHHHRATGDRRRHSGGQSRHLAPFAADGDSYRVSYS
jgi:hypothetical protein